MTKDVRDKLLRVSELEEQRDALKTTINTAEDADAPDAAALDRLGTELRTAEGDLKTARTEYRAAVEAEPETGAPVVEDAEYREKLTLRAHRDVSFGGGFLLPRMQGRMPSGAAAEYAAACGVKDGNPPIDIFEKDRPAPVEHRADVATVVPATGTGATLAPIQPFVFARSIAPRLGIAMPTVGSGAYSEATITTALTAAAKAKGAAQESTAAVLTPATATPRRISARLTLNIEDLAAIGQANFESALRQNLSMGLSNAYDLQCITGDGVAPNVDGLIHQLTNPADPTATASFDLFLEAFSDQIDGLWASTLAEVALITNAGAYKLSATKFRDTSTDLGSISFANYAMQHTGGWSCNSRMPATVNDIARAIVYRRGGQMLDAGMGAAVDGGGAMMGEAIRTASHPVWATLSIDDIYSDSGSGQRHVTMHLLVGDKVLLVQPDAYGLAEFLVA